MKFVSYFYFLICLSITSYPMQAPKHPIITAAANGDLPMIQSLLDYGVDVNTVDQKNQANALFWALDNGQTDIAYYLVNHTNININARNIFGSSALILARFKYSQLIVDALLNRNDIDVTTANNTGRTFLDFELINDDTNSEKLKKILDKADTPFFYEHGARLAALAKQKGFYEVAQEIENKTKKIKLV